MYHMTNITAKSNLCPFPPGDLCLCTSDPILQYAYEFVLMASLMGIRKELH